MIIQLKKDSTEEFVFDEESSLNFPCYTELIKVLSEMLDKMPPYLNTEKVWQLYVTDCCLEEKYNLPYAVEGVTDFKSEIIYIRNTLSGVFQALPHEIGHMVDKMLGISETDSFKKIFLEYKKKYKGSNLFQSLGLVNESLTEREFFAEAFRVFISDEYFDLYSRKDYTFYDDRAYFKDLYYIMRRCVDLLFFKQNKDLVEFSETKPKEYFTVFDEDIA